MRNLFSDGSGLRGSTITNGRSLIFKWHSSPGINLRTWTTMPLVVIERTEPGVFEVAFTIEQNSAAFYRLRQF